MKIKTKQIVASVLAILNIAGTVGVFVSATKYAPKMKKEVDELKSNGKNPGKKETLKIFCKNMAVPLSLTALTSLAGGASVILSRKAEVSLGASILALEKGYQQFSDKVKSEIGKDKKEEMLTQIAKDNYDEIQSIKSKKNDKRILYWMEHVGYFLADPELVALSYADLNQRIQISDYVGGTHYFGTLRNFLEQCDAEILDRNISRDELEHWGWSYDYLGDVFEYYWIHMHWDEVNDGDKKFRKIWFDEEPVYGYLSWAEDHDGTCCMTRDNSDGPVETPFNTSVDAVDPEI